MVSTATLSGATMILTAPLSLAGAWTAPAATAPVTHRRRRRRRRRHRPRRRQRCAPSIHSGAAIQFGPTTVLTAQHSPASTTGTAPAATAPVTHRRHRLRARCRRRRRRRHHRRHRSRRHRCSRRRSRRRRRRSRRAAPIHASVHPRRPIMEYATTVAPGPRAASVPLVPSAPALTVAVMPTPAP